MSDVLHQGALPLRPRGRAAGLNPGNRFESVRLHVLGEAIDDARREHPEGVQLQTEILEDHSRSILNRVQSPDLPLEWTLNPYRGCEHGCAYCYARPTHETLGLSSGLDFERRILAKRNAPQLLRRELARPGWNAEAIMMSGVTDPYQPIERSLRITRACLEILAECRQPVGVITKNALVRRDIDLLAELASHNAASVAISLTSLDPAVAAAMEPRAASPARRLETIRRLASAGVPVTVMVAPVVPALTDHEIPKILEAAADAGATRAGLVLLRLPHQVKEIFADWLERAFPDRAAHVLAAVRETHGGALYDPRWHVRGRGQGQRAEQIRAAFRVFARRHNLDSPRAGLSSAAFRRPTNLEDGQLALFARAPE